MHARERSTRATSDINVSKASCRPAARVTASAIAVRSCAGVRARTMKHVMMRIRHASGRLDSRAQSQQYRALEIGKISSRETKVAAQADYRVVGYPYWNGKIRLAKSDVVQAFRP